MVAPFFGPKIGEDQKKGLRRKIGGFAVQMRIGTKQSKKKRSSPQIGGVIVSHHSMVPPKNGETRRRPPPSDATDTSVALSF